MATDGKDSSTTIYVVNSVIVITTVMLIIGSLYYGGILSGKFYTIKQAVDVGVARHVIDPTTGKASVVWVLPNGTTEVIE